MAAPAAVSIRNCLSQALPHYDYAGRNHTPSPGGQTTQSTIPPRFAVQRAQGQRWSTVGQGYLGPANYQVGNAHGIVTARAVLQHAINQGQTFWQSYLDHANGFLGGTQFIPERETNITHSNESDVVRTAALYLVHPVIQALCAHPQYRGVLISQSEDTQGGTRTDVTFKQVHANGNRGFVVVEFKRRGAIAGANFNHRAPAGPPGAPAIPAANTLDVAFGVQPTPQQVASVTAVVPPAQAGSTTLTMFSTGALHLIKQATAYAIQHRTRYVVLFNYDWMICCYFPWVDPTQTTAQLQAANRASQGHFPVEVDCYNVTNAASAAEMRLALLGFMWTAVENTP